MPESLEKYNGPERRSKERQQYENHKADKLVRIQVEEGVRERVYSILSAADKKIEDNGIFSRSTMFILQRMAPEITFNKGVATIHKENDEFGTALLPHDVDSKVIFVLGGETSLCRVQRTPCIIIPQIPASHELVQEKARRGELRFEYTQAKTMAVASFENNRWSDIAYVPAGSVEIEPTADRYGQAIFGGNRALRLPDGSIWLFRPDMHAERFKDNAERLMIPPIPAKVLMEIYKTLARANEEYIPECGLGSLYLAPGLRASGNQIGVKPNTKYLFTCLAIPAGKIFDKPLKLKVETKFHRAARGGVGDIKAGGNYAPTFKPKADAKEQGCDDIIYLDENNAETRELSSSNIFFVREDKSLVTPDLSGEILPGVTRDSILAIANELMGKGVIKRVEQRPVFTEEYQYFTEAFSCGTGVTINPIALIETSEDKCELDISEDGMGPVTKAIFEKFNAILRGEEMQNQRYKNWLMAV